MQSPFILRVVNLSKTFPGVQALDSVSLEIRPGEAYAVMGENGAGKSTLMKILAGLYPADSGGIFLEGRSLRLKSPHQALRLGIAMIHQELLPFPNLTVAENIFMGREPAARFGWIHHRALNRQAAALLERLNLDLPPSRKMRELSVAQMQAVEIAKALVHEVKVLIMDEPTSAISVRETGALFEIIHSLKKRRVAVLYVSHKLDEVFRVADRVTVLRDGRLVASHPIAEVDANRLIALMAGRELGALAPQSPAKPGEAALAVRQLTRAGKFHDVTFELRRGEVLGFAGLLGAGRTDLVNALFGLAPADSGEIRVRGKPVSIRKPSDAMARGLALVSEDRKRYGLVLNMSVQHNLTLARLRQFCRGFLIHHAAENRVTRDALESFAIKTSGRRQRARFLSGGNQQKLVLAKSLLGRPDILLLDEPTRGIDVAAKAEIYRLIRRLAGEGKAILLVSSELPELLALSDRILVMRAGHITAELSPACTTQEEILRQAMPRS